MGLSIKSLPGAWGRRGPAKPPTVCRARSRAAIVFAPAGELVPRALECLEKGGTLAVAGIYLSAIPALDYTNHLFFERDLRSVTSNTRQDGEDLLVEAVRVPIRPEVPRLCIRPGERSLAGSQERPHERNGRDPNRHVMGVFCSRCTYWSFFHVRARHLVAFGALDLKVHVSTRFWLRCGLRFDRRDGRFGGSSMRWRFFAMALGVVVFGGLQVEAGPPHGGGHAGGAPRAPHFSPPPVPHFHFSQPKPAQQNAAHSSAMRQGGFSPGYTSAGYYYRPRHSTSGGTKNTSKLHQLSNALQASHPAKPSGQASMTGRTRTTTKLHQLSNALQESHASNGSSRSASHSVTSQGGSVKATSAAPSAATTATSGTARGPSPLSNSLSLASNGAASGSGMPAGNSAIKSTFSLANTETGGTTPATSAGQSPIKSTLSLSNTGSAGTAPTTSAGQSPIMSTLSLSNSGSSAAPAGSSFSMTKTAAKLPNAIGSTGNTAALTSTGSTTSTSATNPTGPAARSTSAYFSLMSELYGPYGLPHYSPYGYGNGYGRNRYYGSRYSGYGRQNYNGNRNNSMYFAQMRRISRLANDLAALSRRGGGGAGAGLGASAGVGINGNMTSRIRGDLIGVVFGNSMPPYQSVHQLAADLVTHLPSRTVSMFNSGQLARNLMVVMNGGGQNPTQIQSAIGGAHSLLNMSGVNAQGIQTIVNDMGMVATGGNGFMN